MLAKSNVTEKKCAKCGGTRFHATGRCAPCTNAAAAKWRAENPEKMKECIRNWVKANPEKNSPTTNPAVKASKDNWRKNNPEKWAAYNNKRRARLMSCEGSLSKEIFSRLIALQGGKCLCCGLPLGVDFHLDHIVPLALGGSNTDDNVQLMRKSCNLSKGARHPVDYMQQKGFLL